MKDIKFEVIKKISDFKIRSRDFSSLSKLDSISPPSVFIGSKLKYPLVNVGIMSPLEKDENAWIYDDMKYWANNNFDIKDVLMLRNSLLNSRFQSKVSDARMNGKMVDIAKNIAVASKPVNIEIEFNERLRFERDKDKVLTPHGYRAGIKRAEITGNVKIERQVDKVINDDIKASESVEILYKNNINEYALSKILSVGVLGIKNNRRLVPTRWSITATDDIIGKSILEKVRNYSHIENYELFYGEFLGNCYLILFFPGVWSYELFELYEPGSSWNPSEEYKASTDSEGFHGRKEYAFSTAGGYYASRLPIIEYLNSIKKQASVLAIRIETSSYWAALGVWVVRESVRKALNQKIKFADRNELIESAKKIGLIKYNFNISEILSKSTLLKNKKEQKILKDFFV